MPRLKKRGIPTESFLSNLMILIAVPTKDFSVRAVAGVRMKELIEYVAKSIVDQPQDVNVSEETDQGKIIFRLHVAEGDIGKVIGRQGRIIRALRTLLKVASIKEGSPAVLEIEGSKADSEGYGQEKRYR